MSSLAPISCFCVPAGEPPPSQTLFCFIFLSSASWNNLSGEWEEIRSLMTAGRFKTLNHLQSWSLDPTFSWRFDFKQPDLLLTIKSVPNQWFFSLSGAFLKLIFGLWPVTDLAIWGPKTNQDIRPSAAGILNLFQTLLRKTVLYVFIGPVFRQH